MREIYTSWLDDEDGDDEDKGRQPDMPMTSGPVQNALFKSRTVLIFGEVDMKMAERVTAQITAFSAESDKANPRHHQFAGRPCGMRRHHPRHDPLLSASR